MDPKIDEFDDVEEVDLTVVESAAAAPKCVCVSANADIALCSAQCLFTWQCCGVPDGTCRVG